MRKYQTLIKTISAILRRLKDLCSLIPRMILDLRPLLPFPQVILNLVTSRCRLSCHVIAAEMRAVDQSAIKQSKRLFRNLTLTLSTETACSSHQTDVIHKSKLLQLPHKNFVVDERLSMISVTSARISGQ